MIKVLYMYEWKCHNETPHLVKLIYANKNNVSWVWWLTSVIPATQEEEIRRIAVRGQSGQKLMRPPSQSIW
jgi:hypothetical protein